MVNLPDAYIYSEKEKPPYLRLFFQKQEVSDKGAFLYGNAGKRGVRIA